MASTSLPERMYFHRRGYFAFPLTSLDSDLEGLAEWQTLADRVVEAMHGQFAAIATLREQYQRDADWVRHGAYVKLLGDAGPDDVLEQLHQELRAGATVFERYDLAETLFYWGRLDVVPTLVELWRDDYTFQDSYYIPPRLALLLYEEPGVLDDFPVDGPPAKADALRKRVLARHAELRDRLGGHAFVFRGRLLDVEHVARRALADLAEGTLDPEMRHKLEAMTGIDCSGFYVDGTLHPLAAAVVLEGFLAGPSPSRFVAGRRYFFGHPVPVITTTSDPLASP